MSVAEQNIQPHEGSPLEHLETMFKDDMARVNALILERFQSDIALIPKVAAYLIASGGKRIRPLLTLAAASLSDEGMQGTEKALGFAAAVEFIHTATLLHDDVVDESETRRGKHAANLVFGNQASILVGDFLFSKAFELMVESNNMDALNVLAKASATIAEGEVLQMSLKGNLDITKEQYFKIIESKTAALFRAATQSGAIITEQNSAQKLAMYYYGHDLGIAFQIADDVMDYVASEQKMGKKAGDDFAEGKITMPVLLAYQAAKQQNRVNEIDFWKRTMSDNRQENGDFEQALELIHTHNTINETISLTQQHAEKAKKSLEIFQSKNDSTVNVLSNLVDFVVHRSS